MNNEKAIYVMKNLAFLSGTRSHEDCENAINTSIKALELVDKITEIIKNEQQATSCEHTKLKSFELIEKIITDYQLSF